MGAKTVAILQQLNNQKDNIKTPKFTDWVKGFKYNLTLLHDQTVGAAMVASFESAIFRPNISPREMRRYIPICAFEGSRSLFIFTDKRWEILSNQTFFYIYNIMHLQFRHEFMNWIDNINNTDMSTETGLICQTKLLSNNSERQARFILKWLHDNIKKKTL